MNSQAFPELTQVSEIELCYKNPVPFDNRLKVNSTSTALEIFRCSWDSHKMELIEQFKILLLDIKSNCLGVVHLTTGIHNFCPIDLRHLFATAILANASAIIIAHNHPSGDKNPSPNDIEATKKIKQAGKLLGIKLLDHIILTTDSHYSFAHEGKLLK